MPTPVVKSRLFEADFAAISLYLCEANPDAALRFVDAVESAIKMLKAHPEMGPVWKHASPDHPARFLLVPGFRNYLIFYRLESGVVRVGRLLHGARDIQDVLGD